MRTSRCLAMGALIGIVAVGCSSNSTHPRTVPTSPRASGEAGKPASSILSDARAALLAAKSVRVTGTFTVGGASGASVQGLDLRLSRVNGTPSATGTVTTVTGSGAKATTVTIALIRLGDHLYIRGDRAYYARIGPKAVAVAGRWLSLPTSQDTAVADLTDLATVASGFTSSSNDRVTGTALLGGVPVVVVKAGTDATLYVAASGPARPLRLQRSLTTPTRLDGTLDFSEYDAPLTIAAPAGAIDIAKVRG